jgi:hypothetical protein
VIKQYYVQSLRRRNGYGRRMEKRERERERERETVRDEKV